MGDWLAHARAPSVVVRATKTALLVGVIPVVIHPGDSRVEGGPRAISWSKLVLTSFVPYAVSTSSSVASRREGLALGAAGESTRGDAA